METRMQILLVIAVAAAAVFQTPSAHGRVTRSESVLVRVVLDGDTIDVVTIGRVRLLGIDAPEIGRGFDTPAPFGEEARARLTALVLRRWVRLEYEGAATDVYNRRLAYVVTEDGQFVNAVLVREGLARVVARTPLVRLRELQRAQAEAQAFRRGMWGQAPASPAPSYTRRSKASRPPPSTTSRSKAPSAKRRTTRQKKHREHYPCRVRVRTKDPRAQQALLPVQPLADLDFRLLHRARAAHLRSL
jgi:micrococcal nuclease